MRSHRLPFLTVSLALVLASGCASRAVCGDDDDSSGDTDNTLWPNPYPGWQDAELPESLIEVEGVAPGGEQRVSVVLSNDGDYELTVESVSLASWSDSNWVLDEDSVPEEIDAGDSVTVEVVFTNDRFEDSHASVEFFTDDPDEAKVAVGLVGRSANASPQAQLLPSKLDFGFVYTGSDTPGTLSLANNGGSELSIESIDAPLIRQNLRAAIAQQPRTP